MNIGALLDLQRVDTSIDQSLAALQRLPERQRHAEAASGLSHLRSRRDDLRREQSVQESELADIETETSSIDAKRTRLEKQMKSVIAPREAEALQHEMAALDLQRGELDDRGLLLLESSSEADRELERLAAEEQRAVVAEMEARKDLEAATAVAEAAIASLRERRLTLASVLDHADLSTYESLRSAHGGVAVAVVEHGMCTGCNMDLSVAERDAIKRRPADEIVECPNCNRLIAR